MIAYHHLVGRLPLGGRFFALLVCLAACSLGQAMAQDHTASPPKVRVEGTSLRIDEANGSSLSGPQLAGKEIQIGQPGALLRLRIDSVTADPRAPGVWLHEISAIGDDGAWRNICTPDADGRQAAVVLAGYTRSDGNFVPDSDKLSISCTSGAQGKCLRFGYSYWTTGPHGESLLPHFQACMRMVRADYCGDGRSWTKNGMKIDVYDDVPIQVAEKDDPMPFEAGWTSEGAVCVNHVRVTENGSLSTLAQQCPRLAAVSGSQCSEDWARIKGKAVLFNRSNP